MTSAALAAAAAVSDRKSRARRMIGQRRGRREHAGLPQTEKSVTKEKRAASSSQIHRILLPIGNHDSRTIVFVKSP